MTKQKNKKVSSELANYLKERGLYDGVMAGLEERRAQRASKLLSLKAADARKPKAKKYAASARSRTKKT